MLLFLDMCMVFFKIFKLWTLRVKEQVYLLGDNTTWTTLGGLTLTETGYI